MVTHHLQHQPPAPALAPAAPLQCRCPPNAIQSAVVAVHNIGCALLEADLYEAAHLTLTDAARAMATLFGDHDRRCHRESSDGEDVNRSNLLTEVVASMLAAANHRLACPRPAAADRSQVQFTLLPPLRIEVEEMDDAPCLAVMTAISLHNFGISCFYLSTAAPLDGDDAQVYLQTKAILLLQSSYSIMMDCGTFSPSTLGYALHVLENLDVASRLSLRGGHYHRVRAATVAVQDELAWLRATVQAFEAADMNILGRSVFAAAA